jgi:hypothetical protein
MKDALRHRDCNWRATKVALPETLITDVVRKTNKTKLNDF